MMKLSLIQRIFLAFSGLLILTLGLASGITYYRGNKIASDAVVSSLENIRQVQEGFEQQRFQQLALISELFASDPYFSSYVAEATGSDLGFGGEVDSASIVDILRERRVKLEFDFAIVLDTYGEIIAHTDDDSLIGGDLSADPVVSPVIKSLESSTGYWFKNSGAFQVAVVPLADQRDLVGFLVTGLAVDDVFVNDVKSISGSELVFIKQTDNAYSALASTLQKKDLQLLLTSEELIQNNLNKSPIQIKLSDQIWLASITTAGDADNAGISVALTSLDNAAKNFRAIEKVLFIVTVISIVLALPFSLLIARGVLSPVRKLAKASQLAARGDYQQRFDSRGSDDLAKLTSSFDILLSDLREKSDMQGYMADLAKYLPDSLESKVKGVPTEISQPKQTGKFTLLGIELRRFVKQADSSDPEEVFSLLNAALQNIHHLARSYNGRLVGIIGHRVIVIFGEEDSFKRALAMAGSVLTSLFSEGEGIATAVADGQAVFGSATIADNEVHNVLGSSVYQLNRILAEAKSGYIFITPSILEQIKSENSSFRPALSEGLISKKKYYCLKVQDVEQFDDQVEKEGDTLHGTQVTAGGTKKSKRIHIVPGMSLGGRYEIISELGAGGMGVVYKAHDHELQDLVALKMLKVQDAEGASAFLEAMKSEIRLARKITHPAVLRTYDYGMLESVPYISMEYVRGLTLKYLLQQNEKIPYTAGIRIAKQMAAGLQAAHEQGVLHRDIKPENLILEHNGNAKIMDFGIARHEKGEGLGELEMGIVGTPRYAAPEQLQSKTVDARADIYSAGTVIYHMYTAKFPFRARNMQRLINTKTTEDPIPPSQYWKEIPVELEDLIMKCIARDPEDRFKSAELLLEAIEKLRV